MSTTIKKWSVFTFVVAFTAYWLANLLLWYPWSYSASLGMTLMFVAITPIWMISVFVCLKRSPQKSLIRAALLTSLIFGIIAVVFDYVFYGLIRDAMTELYHPTTLYGYAFLVVLPFAEIGLLKQRLSERTEIRNDLLVKFAILGLACFLAIVAIVLLELTLPEGTFRFLTLIIASIPVFNIVLLVVLGSAEYRDKISTIGALTFLCVVVGMMFGKYGANLGLPWWIYYPVPLLMNVCLPPFLLRMGIKQISVYLVLSLLSAPLIHAVFSFFFGWNEYMPFLEIPSYRSLLD